MELAKIPRNGPRAAAQKSRLAAVRAHFSGEGAVTRSLAFARDGLLSSTSWFAQCVMYASWGLVGMLLLGYGEGEILSKVHAWLLAMPVEQLRSLLLAMAGQLAMDLAKIGLLAGFVEQLLRIAHPPASTTVAALAAP